MIDLVDHAQAVDVGTGREEEEDKVTLGDFSGIDGKASVVAQMIDVGGLARDVLDEETITVTRVGLIAVLGICRNLNPRLISQTLAGCRPHAVITQCTLPTHKVVDRTIESAVGLGGKETLLTVIIFMPNALIIRA